ncbi:MAG TPA: hypothetical protein PK904_19890 [Bacteroidales bacterium]|nr:hypothetical protein [Bacteroidales bacterium]
MKKIKRLNLTISGFSPQRIFIFTVMGTIAFLGILFNGCNKEEDNNEYYVKYEVNSSTIYYGGKLNVTVNTETNSNTTYTVNTRSPWETVVGPVRKGFHATLNVESPGDSYIKLYTQISVSINGDPFVLKKLDGSDEPRNSVYIDYTIE